MLDGEDTSLREDTDGTLVRALGNDRRMGLQFHKVEHLTITEEEHDTGFHHILEDEIFVIVADLYDVTHDKVIKSGLPLGSEFIGLRVIVDLLLGDFSIEDFLVHTGTEMGRNSTLSVLDEEGLVVLLKKALPDQDSFINEGLFFVHTNLTHLDVQFDKTASDALKRGSFELELDCAPSQILILRIVNRGDLSDGLVETLPIENGVSSDKVAHWVSIADLVDGDLVGLLISCLFSGGRLGLATSDGDAIIIFACSIIIVLLLWSGFLRRCLFLFLKSHNGLTTVPDEVGQFVFEVLVPLLAARLQAVHRLILLVEKGVGKSGHVSAILELGRSNFRGLIEVAVSIEELVHLVLNLCLQIELFQQPWDLLLNV